MRIGISGWRYAGWRGDFYPTGLVQRRELAYAAERLTSIEVNGSFYALQRPASWERRHDVACVLADTAGRWPRVDRLTTDLAYVRLHGDRELYASGYDDRALDAWAERFRHWSATGVDVWCYFDNDAKGHAPYDAMRLIERLTD